MKINFRWFKRQTTKFRITIGMVSIIITVLLLAVFLGLFPDERKARLEARVSLAEIVAANSTLMISQRNIVRMKTLLELVVERNEDIVRAVITDSSAEEVVIIGSEVSENLIEVSVPIYQSNERWGEVKLWFTPLYPNGWIGFFYQPAVHLILFVAVFGFVILFLYLGRILKLLDPSQAIPDRVRSALDTMAEGLLVLDSRENIVLANESFSTLVKMSKEDLIGIKASRFKWTNDANLTLDGKSTPWNKALKTQEVDIGQRIRLQLSPEEQRTFIVNCSPVLGESGKAGGVLVSFDDVTLLDLKEKELEKSKLEAEQANQTKSDFLANMSHEIRTPMNAIMGFTEILRRGYGKGVHAKQHLETIAKNSAHLLDLINDILDLSKVESGSIEVEIIPCALHEVIMDVIQVMSVNAERKGVLLSYKPTGPLPATINTDPARVRQIITNLIGNAIKFTESGGIDVITRFDPKNKNKLLYIDVVDTGIGMDKEQCQKIFDPFVQADSSITRRFGGTGLGLTISKRFAEALGGDIEVSSEPQKGSKFTVSIAYGDIQKISFLQPNKLTAFHNSEAKTERLSWTFEPADVLVVDDGEENRSLVQLVLEHSGLTVEVARDGLEGMEKALAGDFELVLMDVQMPVMDGYTAIKNLRQKSFAKPVVALTAHAMKGIEEKCKDAGFDGYLAKPIKIDEMLNYISQWLAGQPVVDLGSDLIDEMQNIAMSDDEALKEDTTNASDNNGSTNSIVSSMQDNPRYRPVLIKFVERLACQINAMDDAFGKRDLDEVAHLAHWLKGSAGTVGYDSFTQPAAALENAALEGNINAIPLKLIEIKVMYRQIRLDDFELPVLSNTQSVTQRSVGG